MSETDAELFRQETEQCRQFAEKALKPLDKEALLRLAGEWLQLAQNAEQRRSLYLKA